VVAPSSSVIGVEDRLLGETPDVVVSCGVVNAVAITAGADDPSHPQFG